MMKKRLNLVLFFLLVAVLVSAWTMTLAAKQQTIKFSVWDYSMEPEYQAVLKAFEQENPDIKVDVIDIAAKEYPDKMTVMLAAGEDVDVFSNVDLKPFYTF